VKRKKSQSRKTAPSETAIVPRSWIENATPATSIGRVENAFGRPAGGAVDDEEEPERDHHHREHRRAFDRTDHGSLDRGAAEERDRDREREGGPVGEAVVDQRPGDEGREHRHLALREVDDAGGAVDQDERDRERRPHSARGESDHDLLRKLRPVEGEQHQ